MIQEVIDELKKYCEGKTNLDKAEVSVIQLKRFIAALEQEPCNDAISRQAVDNLFHTYRGLGEDTVIAIYEQILDLPSVQPTLKVGKLIKLKNKLGQHKIQCSCCSYLEPEYVTFERNFCPKCGARLETE